jgi:hypothetical protein
MFKQGEFVKIRKEWQDDASDDLRTWVVTHDEIDSRVHIRLASDPAREWPFPPSECVKPEMIERIV